jgi:TolA-binding protein
MLGSVAEGLLERRRRARYPVKMVSALPSVAELLPPLLGNSAGAALVLYGGAILAALVVLLGLWLWLGRGPQRRRQFARARRLLQRSAFKEALDLVHGMEHQRQSASWMHRLQTLQGQAHRGLGRAALDAKNYETALEQGLYGARLLNLPEADVRDAVRERMLAEVRRLFAGSRGSDTAAVHELLGRLFALQTPCPEASFWQGLCRLREGDVEAALGCLQAARSSEGEAATGYVDPLLYLGSLLLRKAQPKEALRYLTEANRLDRNCPLVTWQLSTAMLAGGGDAAIAVRALQRALGPQGLLLWAQTPQRLWVEAFPENRSYLRRLASEHPYTCPLWGSDLQAILRQGQTTLAEGLYRLGRYQEAAELFDKVAKHSAPSRVVLRGLGLALARLERYDEAFTHLRTAHDLEEPKERVTAGYLALCAAQAKPLRPEDREKNVAWGIRLVTRYTAPADAEWAGIINKLFAQARELALSLGLEDQLYLCEHLLSVRATDPDAAAAYQHLAASFPNAARPEYAWLYCRAAQQHGGSDGLALFARTFAEEAAARAFFQAQGWDFNEMEFAYLQQAATQQPGTFPAALGADYPPRGEHLLQERSLRQEQANDPEGTRRTAEVWLKLAPRSPAAHDRLAYLHYRAGGLAEAAALLAGWQALEPHHPVPLLRLAVIHQQRGDAARSTAAVSKALARMQGPGRAEAAFLGARLALQSGPAGKKSAVELLEICLQQDPRHWQALACLAALHSAEGDRAGLAALAPAMKDLHVDQPRCHLLAAICHLAAGDYATVLEACQRAAGDPALAVESAYLMGWAMLYRQDAGTAALTLRRVAENPDSPSAPYAQALLGGLCYRQGDYEAAIRWWTILAPERRQAWKLTEPLQQTALLSALKHLEAGKYVQAAEKIREAATLGMNPRRLGPLLTLALVKAAQKIVYEEMPIRDNGQLERESLASAGTHPAQA